MENKQSNPVELGAKTYPDTDRMILGFEDGSLSEYSFKLDEILYDFGKVLNYVIIRIAKTVDNKYIFVCA